MIRSGLAAQGGHAGGRRRADDRVLRVTVQEISSRTPRQARGGSAWLILVPGVITLAVMLTGISASSYWTDEDATISAVTRSLPQLFAMLKNQDVTHGLYYVLLWPVAHIAGTSEFVLRLPSATAMALAAAGIAEIGRRLASVKAGVLAGLVFALEPVISLWGQNARPYAVSVTSAVLSSYLLLLLLERPSAWRAAGYAASVALLGYLNLICMLLLAAHAVTVYRAWRAGPGSGYSTGGLRRWLVATVTGCVLVAPFALFAWGQRHSVSWLHKPSLDSVGELAVTVGAGTTLTAVILAALAGYGTVKATGARAGAAAATGAAAGAGARRPFRRLGWLCVPWLLLPTAILLGVSLLHPFYDTRYIIFVLPAAALLAGAGLAALPVALWVGLLGLLTFLVLPGQRAVRGPTANGQDIRGIASILQAQARPSDALIFWIGNGGLRGFEPTWGITYAGFAIPQNVALQETPVQVNHLGGRGIRLPALQRRLATFSRVWVVEQQQYPSTYTTPSVLPRQRFSRVAGYGEPGFWLVLYTRTRDPAGRR